MPSVATAGSVTARLASALALIPLETSMQARMVTELREPEEIVAGLSHRLPIQSLPVRAKYR